MIKQILHTIFRSFLSFSTFGQVIDSKRKKVLESTEKLVYNIHINNKKQKESL